MFMEFFFSESRNGEKGSRGKSKEEEKEKKRKERRKKEEKRERKKEITKIFPKGEIFDKHCGLTTR